MSSDSDAELIPVQIERVLPFRDSAAVVLAAPEKRFMIFVGSFEAAAIMRELRDERTERPLTHDVISYLMAGFDIRVNRIVISSIINSVFCATMVMEQDRNDGDGGKNEVRLDLRASDSMVIALKTETAIWVTRRVLAAVEDVTEQLEYFDERIAQAQDQADQGDDDLPWETEEGEEEIGGEDESL